MKNLRKLVPKEELDALFREVYQIEYKEQEQQKKEENKENRKYNVFAYKIQKVIKRTFVSLIPVNFSIKNFSIKTFDEEESKNFISTGYDLENKFRFYISIDQTIEGILEKLLIKESIIDSKNIQLLIEKFLDNTAVQILDEFQLKKKRVASSQLSFYDEEVITISFHCKIDKANITICVSFEEIFLDIFNIKPIIFSQPTSIGKKNLKAIKRYIPIQVISETFPLNIPANLLKENQELTFRNIKIRKTKVL